MKKFQVLVAITLVCLVYDVVPDQPHLTVEFEDHTWRTNLLITTTPVPPVPLRIVFSTTFNTVPTWKEDGILELIEELVDNEIRIRWSKFTLLDTQYALKETSNNGNVTVEFRVTVHFDFSNPLLPRTLDELSNMANELRQGLANNPQTNGIANTTYNKESFQIISSPFHDDWTVAFRLRFDVDDTMKGTVEALIEEQIENQILMTWAKYSIKTVQFQFQEIGENSGYKSRNVNKNVKVYNTVEYELVVTVKFDIADLRLPQKSEEFQQMMMELKINLGNDTGLTEMPNVKFFPEVFDILSAPTFESTTTPLFTPATTTRGRITPPTRMTPPTTTITISTTTLPTTPTTTEPRTTLPTTTITISTTTLPTTPTTTEPTTWTTPKCGNDIKLVGGSSSTQGLVEVIANNHSWATICAEGVGLNEAKVLCRMLCFDVNNALPVMYNFPSVQINSILGLKCTGNERSIRECSYAPNTGKCSDQNVMGLFCDPIPMDTGFTKPIESVVCNNGRANVALSKLDDPTISPDVIVVNSTLSNSCNLSFTEDSVFVNVSFQFDSCNPVVQANATHITYTTTLLKFNYTSDPEYSNYTSEIADYTMDVTCVQPKSSDASGGLNVKITDFAELNVSDHFISNMTIYRTPYFQQPVIWPQNVMTGKTLYAVVSLNTRVNGLRFFLNRCWATSDNNKNSPRVFEFIKNKCAQGNSRIFPINDTTVMFSFKPVQFLENDSGKRAGQPTYLWCNTFTCKNNENSQYCLQACNTSVPPFQQRRNKRSVIDVDTVFRSGALRMQRGLMTDED